MEKEDVSRSASVRFLRRSRTRERKGRERVGSQKIFRIRITEVVERRIS